MTVSRVGAQPEVSRVKMVVRAATAAKQNLVLGAMGEFDFLYIRGAENSDSDIFPETKHFGIFSATNYSKEINFVKIRANLWLIFSRQSQSLWRDQSRW
jgi:hypothetical protein